MERFHIYGVELSRLRNLSNSNQPPRKIHFRLESGTLPVRDSYLDLYVPEFHQYGSQKDRPVRHLDITSTWRGLSVAHAEELKFWEDMFAAVLEYTISNHLIDLLDGMDDCNIDRYPGDLDGRICKFMNNLGSKAFPVNTREMIGYMLELYKRHGDQHRWLVSGGNLYNALCEFLRTRDCFLDMSPQPLIKVSFSASLSGQGEPNVVGILKRFGPLVGFSRLDTYTSEEAWCHIHPSYVEPVLDPAYPSLLGRPEYHLASDWIKFDWRNDNEGFRGYVRPIPFLQQEVSTPLNVDLAAVSKRFFPQEVAFERHLRIRIKLSVCRASSIPTASPKDESMPALQRCKKRRSFFDTPPGLQDLDQVMKASKRTAASSPAKPPVDILSLLKQTCLPSLSPLTVNAKLERHGWPSPPIEKPWGRNVPAWGTVPHHRADSLEAIPDVDDPTDLSEQASDPYRCQDAKGKEKLRSPESLLREWPTPRPSTSLRRKKRSGTSPYTSSWETTTSNDPTQASPSNLPSSFRPSVLSHFEISDDEYDAVQQLTRAESSPQSPSESSDELEMKPVSRPNVRTPGYTISNYPGSSWSSKAPATGSPICPASAPPPARKRVDSVLGISERRRPSSAIRALTQDTDSSVFATAETGSRQHENFPTWVRWRNSDSTNDNEPSASSVEGRAPVWYGPPPDVDVSIEELRRGMREWYDAMVLQRDTPRRKTSEEKSEEEAYARLFVGGDSGDEGDVELST